MEVKEDLGVGGVSEVQLWPNHRAVGERIMMCFLFGGWKEAVAELGYPNCPDKGAKEPGLLSQHGSSTFWVSLQMEANFRFTALERLGVLPASSGHMIRHGYDGHVNLLCLLCWTAVVFFARCVIS